jgi:hypothetical protein
VVVAYFGPLVCFPLLELILAVLVKVPESLYERDSAWYPVVEVTVEGVKVGGGRCRFGRAAASVRVLACVVTGASESVRVLRVFQRGHVTSLIRNRRRWAREG